MIKGTASSASAGVQALNSISGADMGGGASGGDVGSICTGEQRREENAQMQPGPTAESRGQLLCGVIGD